MDSRTHCEQVKAELLNLKYILETKIQKYSGEYWMSISEDKQSLIIVQRLEVQNIPKLLFFCCNGDEGLECDCTIVYKTYKWRSR